ncbi:MAG: glycosyltransferase [Prevotellaceae bacterium]|nr:glycosyltransferase [Prevotellaceae bacterium]
MNEPLISVIVPVYNAGEYLRECIESVISQSFSEWELLLIDDGSTDGSGDIVDEYAEKDKRIRVFHKENDGVCSARNMGLDNAQGEWVDFLDADDYFSKDALRVLHDEAAASGADLIIGSVLSLRDDVLYYYLHKNMPSGVSEIAFLPLERYMVCGYILRREIINEHSLRFVEGLAHAEDWVFLSYYISYCRTMDVLQAPVYIYRMNEASAIHDSNLRAKTPHLFEASNHLYRLAQSYKGVDEKKYKFALRRCHVILKRGIFGMVEEGITRNEYRRMLRSYKELFGDNKELCHFLHKTLPKCYVRLRIKHFPKLERMAKHILGKQDVPPRLYEGTSTLK